MAAPRLLQRLVLVLAAGATAGSLVRELRRVTGGSRGWDGVAAFAVAASAWHSAHGSARRLLGQPASARPLEIHRTVHVAAPVGKVFASWSELGNLPHLLARSAGVDIAGPENGPGTASRPALAEVTRFEPDRLLAWRSLPGAPVAHAGVARFVPQAGGTRLELRISWAPRPRRAA